MSKCKITDSELEIMKVLWDNNPILSSDIVKALHETDWDPKTIHTFLRRLVSKKLVKAKKNGTFYEYTPLINKTEYIIKESKSFLKKIFHGSISNMVYKFVNEGELSPDEFKNLKEMIDAIENKSYGLNTAKDDTGKEKCLKNSSGKANLTQIDYKGIEFREE